MSANRASGPEGLRLHDLRHVYAPAGRRRPHTRSAVDQLMAAARSIADR